MNFAPAVRPQATQILSEIDHLGKLNEVYTRCSGQLCWIASPGSGNVEAVTC